MKEAEAAWQEALDIRRQLAKNDPATYLSSEADTLNDLAIVHIETGNSRRALKEAEEAIGINRKRWKAKPLAAADDLARSLTIASRAHEEPSARCQFAREAASIAHDPDLRDFANRQLVDCPTAQGGNKPEGTTLQASETQPESNHLNVESDPLHKNGACWSSWRHWWVKASFGAAGIRTRAFERVVIQW